MVNRRRFLEVMGLPAAAAAGVTFWPGRAGAILANLASYSASPDEAARDEDFWFEVSQAFSVNRSIINLNNGGVGPSTVLVQDAMKRHLDLSNEAPAHTLWEILEPQRESVRDRLAREFGADKEEIALTRNASEGLETCQLGFDLQPGDEVLATNQDYPRMVNTFKQRERRNGIVFKQFSIPTPCEDPAQIVSRYEQNITPRTRLILVSHMVFCTGQIMPAREVVAAGRARGIPVLVDGAHALAHFQFKISDLDCDYYASSLHKWLCAPHGTGLLYVRKEKIAGLWPLMAAPADLDGNIRKFEEIGTHPAANYLAIGEALTFHQGIGAQRKEARLNYLRNYWSRRLLNHDRIRFHTSLKPQFACAMAVVQIVGLDPAKLSQWLWKEHRIMTAPIKHDEFEGIRVSPNVYTTLSELDRFGAALESVMRTGLPG